MQIVEVRITKFEELEYIHPKKSSSGTGYCEYKKIKVYYDVYHPSVVLISNWYTSKQMQLSELKKHVKDVLPENCFVIYNQETIDKFFECLNE